MIAIFCFVVTALQPLGIISVAKVSSIYLV